MRRLWTTLLTAGLAAAVWAVPTLAAYGGHSNSAKGSVSATVTRRSTQKARATTAGDLLSSMLAPSVPGDPTIARAKPGALPWKLTSGDVVVTDTSILLHLRGFVIPGKGVGPVKTVDASLYCNGKTTAAVTSTATKLSSAGDATIDAPLAVPKSCIAPFVLVHPNGQSDSYVAASGWKR